MNQEPPPPYPYQDQSTGKNVGGSSNVVYPVQGQSSHQHTIVQQPGYSVIQHFRETPVRVKCQFCSADIVTSTFYETGTLTWIACLIIFWFCPFGCCFIPFCMDACKDVSHQCPNCHQQVGRYNRM